MYIKSTLKRNDRRDTTVLNVYCDALAQCDNFTCFTSFVVDNDAAKTILYWYKTYGILQNGFYKIEKENHDVFTKKVDDYMVHIIFKYNPKNNIQNAYLKDVAFIKDENIKFNIVKEEQSLHKDDFQFPQAYIDLTLKTIKNHSTIPIIDAWGEYLTKQLWNIKAFRSLYVQKPEKPEYQHDYGFVNIICLSMYDFEIKNIITKGLQNGDISIDGCNQVSDIFVDTEGLDSYQKNFGNILSEKTKDIFKPKFDPTKDSIDKDVEGFYKVCQYYLPDIKSYSVQKNTIQAIKNHLKTEQNVLISGETGSGKTIMAIGSVVVSAKKKNYTSLVMVPSGLITRWQEAISATIPNAVIRVVRDIYDLLKVKQEIKAVTRISPLWIILSENTAKINYEERPAICWNNKRKIYVCPHCGKPIAVAGHTNQFNSFKDYDLNYDYVTNFNELGLANDLFFMNLNENNRYCNDVVKDIRAEKYHEGCHHKLWTAASRDNSNEWVKLNKCGWLLKNRIPTIKKQLEEALKNKPNTANKTLVTQYNKVLKAINDYELHGVVERFPDRYNIAHYIKKHMKNLFDFGIFDEVHTFAGDSQQGTAFGNLCTSVKKAIFLTGTLSNGYASGFFHILFRTQTQKMLENGFTYNDINKFIEQYGVIDHARIAKGNYEGATFNELKVSKKKINKPGISPLLYADFLINNTVMVTKKDIKKNLCKYQEIPVAVEMDSELLRAYDEVISATSESIQLAKLNKRDIRGLILKASMFLDQPFGLEVYKTNTCCKEKMEILELSPDVIRPKEQKLIEICNKAKENNEKILIYCEYTSRLDIANRLAKILNENNINAITMDTSIDKNKRQKWLEEKANDNIDAVILNPTLVGTGLNLLDYTTIIFYQIGTKLTTIRQASQRSNRINQEKPVTVYFMYYDNTVQSTSLALISQKLKAAKAIEGDFSETALQAMSKDIDVMTQLVSSIVKNENIKVEASNFDKVEIKEETENQENDIQTLDSNKEIFIPTFMNKPIINLNYSNLFCNNFVA